jgi:hypothetical protein
MAQRGAGYKAASLTILVDKHCHFEAVFPKKEKQRKFPFAAFQACTLPQVLRQLVKKISSQHPSLGTFHANLPTSLRRLLPSASIQENH